MILGNFVENWKRSALAGVIVKFGYLVEMRRRSTPANIDKRFDRLLRRATDRCPLELISGSAIRRA